MDQCPVCQKPVPEWSYKWAEGAPGVIVPTEVKCPRCGTYRIADSAAIQLRDIPANNHRRIQLSGAIRERVEQFEPVILADVAATLSSVVVPTDPLDQLDKVLLHVARAAPHILFTAGFNVQTDYPIAYAWNDHELTLLLSRAKDLGLIELPNGISNDAAPVRLTVDKGWQRVRELRTDRRESFQAFVAMWFDKKLDPAFTDGIEPALRACGYDPLRVDSVQHNGKIDDRIIAEIRRSGLVIADFTGHRGGVYFEAGFGLGLGIPVIWTCREDEIGKAHFDTRQYNHITWTTPAQLQERLRARIEATLPTRPARPTPPGP